ncbi:TlpA family protein disulfide reductase [Flectobacillus roseus]
MKKTSLLILLYFTLTTLTSLCQNKNTTTLYGHFYTTSNEIENLDLMKFGVRSHQSRDPDYIGKIRKDKTFKIELNIDTPSFYKVGDLWVGHIIFIEPGDSINITLKPIKDADKRREKGEILSRSYILTTSSRYYGNIIFYDELEKKIGFVTKYKFEDPKIFKKRCDDAYRISMDLLESFKSKKIISENFYKYASEDLRAKRLLSFCTMFAYKDKNKIPRSTWESFLNEKFTDDTYFTSCDSYANAPFVYNYYISNSYNPKSRYQNFDSEFTSILKNHTGLIKDRLLGWEIIDYIGAKKPSFDSCYAIFLKECQNQRIKAEVVKKVKSYVPPQHNKKGSKLTLEEVLSRTKVDEYKKGNIGIKSILSDSLPTLIDCWASWCGPCKFQMPFVHEAEKRFAGKLKVVYLSFDEDEVKWKSHLEKSEHLTNQFWADNSFKSEMAKYFGIKEIPRYILISPKGEKVLNDKMPLPALTEDFDVELKKYLK